MLEVNPRTTWHRRHKLLVSQVTVALTIGLALVDRSIAGVIPHDHHVSVASSYMHFQGPVQGPEYEVKVPHVPVDHLGEHYLQSHHEHHHHDGYTVDYVGKPKYEFSYGVEDHHTGDFHGQKESSDGEWKGRITFMLSWLSRDDNDGPGLCMATCRPFVRFLPSNDSALWRWRRQKLSRVKRKLHFYGDCPCTLRHENTRPPVCANACVGMRIRAFVSVGTTFSY